jgi:GNAT superfamily N-acetyltransferase
MRVPITTYYLEMTSPQQLCPTSRAVAGLEVRRANIPSPELSRFFYTAVGGDWFWLDRIPWTYERWREWVEMPGLETWVAYLEGTPAGYFELERKSPHTVNIAYFGLLPSFIGKGIGGQLLTAAIRRAWAIPSTRRVTVNTCTLDGPQALKNYQARGLQIYCEEPSLYEVPEKTPGPWPGAR